MTGLFIINDAKNINKTNLLKANKICIGIHHEHLLGQKPSILVANLIKIELRVSFSRNCSKYFNVTNNRKLVFVLPKYPDQLQFTVKYSL